MKAFSAIESKIKTKLFGLSFEFVVLSNLREAIELYLEDEDATIPTSKSPNLTTLSVETHAKAETCLRL